VEISTDCGGGQQCTLIVQRGAKCTTPQRFFSHAARPTGTLPSRGFAVDTGSATI
jgi:hypothetical protein